MAMYYKHMLSSPLSAHVQLLRNIHRENVYLLNKQSFLTMAITKSVLINMLFLNAEYKF